MELTNKEKLNSRILELCESFKNKKENTYSINEFIQPIREIILTRRHYNELEEDVSNKIWSIISNLTSNSFNCGELLHNNILPVETNLTILPGNATYIETTKSLEDFKIVSVYKIIKKDFEDFDTLSKLLAYIASLTGKEIKKVKFTCFLKDWSIKDYESAMSRGSIYPSLPIFIFEKEITPEHMVWSKEYISKKHKELNNCSMLKDNDLPLCTEEEKWTDPDKFVVTKPDAERALKVCDTMEEATDYSKTKIGSIIVIRKGEDKKCANYCNGCKFCSQFKEKGCKKD